MSDSENVILPNPSRNSAIQRCLDAWHRTYKIARSRGETDWCARRPAGEAYRAAMPELTSLQNVRDFIACAAHGILIGALEEKPASRLLYAAQVAIGAFRKEPPSAPSTLPADATAGAERSAATQETVA